MRHLRLVVPIAIALAIAACGSTPPSSPVPSPTSALTPTAAPSSAPSPVNATVPPGVSLELACSGPQSATIWEYLTGSTANSDIVDATRRLRGVQPRDVVVPDGETFTVVIRNGRAIWRGSWDPVPGGFMLGGSTSCADVSIGY